VETPIEQLSQSDLEASKQSSESQGGSNASLPPASAATLNFDDPWLHDFYKECGREVTLAYTTLNQMKNWAIVIQAAIIAAVVSLTRSSPDSGGHSEVAVLVAAVLAFLFTVRFFVRAILCYINLLRWNRLQAGIVAVKLFKGEPSATQSSQAEKKLVSDIETYYHGWKSTIPRSVQLVANLKLGFGLLLATPLLVMMYCAIVVPVSPLAVGFVAFGFGGTAIEAVDFFTNGRFDDVKRSAKRKASKEEVFPTPRARQWYVWSWVANLGLSALLAWLAS
jgi:hypothetical protein